MLFGAIEGFVDFELDRKSEISEPDLELPQDLLRGADEIAKSLYGSSADRRKLYHLAATLNLPIFEPGSMIRARNVVHWRWESC